MDNENDATRIDGFDGEPKRSTALRLSTAVRFRNSLSGYNKKEVDEFLKMQQSATDATIDSYEEKLDQMRTSNIMLSHEIENIRRENTSLRTSHSEMSERIREVEVGAAKYDEALLENETLKQRISEFDNIATRAGELEVTVTHLREQLSIAESALASAESRVKTLEDSVNTMSRQMIERDRKNSITTAQLVADRKLSDERRHITIEKLRTKLASLSDGLAALDRETSPGGSDPV